MASAAGGASTRPASLPGALGWRRRVETRLAREALPLLFLLAAAIGFFWKATLAGNALLPVDNLFQYQPWASYAPAGFHGPWNPLISDAILQNYGWKRFLLESLRQRQLPLWDPYVLGGTPFFAPGQASVLYPFTALFLILPIASAYGYFAALHLFIAGASAYAFLRVARVSRTGSVLGGLAFMFSGRLVTSILWPQMMGAVVYLPLLLLFVELAIRRARRSWPVPAIAAGALVLGISILAGHIEASVYVMAAMGLYALARLVAEARGTAPRRWTRLARSAGSCLAIPVLACGVAAVQLLPFYQVGSANFRSGSVTYRDVAGFALKLPQLLTFLMPDFYGNPILHWAPYWGSKDYVEQAAYVGILPLILAAVTLWPLARRLTRRVKSPRGVARLAVHELPSTSEAGPNPHGTAGSPAGVMLSVERSIPHTIPQGTLRSTLRVTLGLFFRRSVERSIPDLLAERDSSLDAQHDLWPCGGTAGGGAASSPETAGETASHTLCPASDKPASMVAALWLIVAISLLLAFGTPLYRVIFFLLPGFNQIHSPFRWLIPYTAAISLLAGFGFDLARSRLSELRWWLAGLAVVAAAGLAPWWRVALPHVPAADRGLEMRNYAIFLTLVAACAVVTWLGRRAFGPLAVALTLADLAFFGIGFNTAVNPRPLHVTPPSIAFLQRQPGIFRVTAYGPGKMLEPNGNLLYDLQDARGYDSVILARYAQLNNAIEPQTELQFNRIKSLSHPSALRSPLLDLLNVKYVLTEQRITQPGWRQVYAGKDGRVYQNLNVLPRAFVASNVVVERSAASQLAALAAPGFDPASTAVVDRSVGLAGRSGAGASSGAPAISPAAIQSYSGRKVSVEATGPGLLVLGDNNFPGWKATVDGQPAPIYTADYTFRGVALPPGQHSVSFTFSPTSLLVGGLASGLSLTLLALLLVAWAWRASARRMSGQELRTAGRVTKNSLTPLVSSLATKLISFGFSVYYFRALGLTQVGKYVTAITVWLFLDTIIGFGLQQLVMRDVARDKARTGAYVTNAVAVRLAMTVVVGLPVAAGVAAMHRFMGFPADTSLVIVLLVVGFVPAAFANVFSHVFDAHELMEYTSFIQVLTSIVNVALGVAFVLAGWNIVGLAVASLLTNVFTALGLWLLLGRRLLWVRPRIDISLIRRIFSGAYPIMLNQLLVVFFFRIDVLVLEAFRGNGEVGIYGAAYKFVDAMLLVPSTFVPAVFPILSRQAASQREALKRGFDLSLKALLLIALPVVAAFEVLGGEIIRGFYGHSFAPSAVALRILMLFLPFSYINGLTQYVLVALDKQRTIIRFFATTAVFNALVNVLLVPRFGFIAASAVTVGSEVVLLIPLYRLTARELGGGSMLRVTTRPLLAAAVAGLSMLVLRLPAGAILGGIAGPLAAGVAGMVIYVLALLALRTFDREELELMRGIVTRRPALPASAPTLARS